MMVVSILPSEACIKAISRRVLIGFQTKSEPIYRNSLVKLLQEDVDIHVFVFRVKSDEIFYLALETHA